MSCARLLRYPGALVVMVGAPGSGKTTWAQHRFEPSQILSLDGLRLMLTDDAGDQDATPAAVELLHRITRQRMIFQRTTVVDMTSANPQHRRDLVDAAKPYSYWMASVAVVMHTPLEMCLERNARRQRNRRVPEAVVRRMHTAIETECAELTTPGHLPPFAVTRHIWPDREQVCGFVATELRESKWLT